VEGIYTSVSDKQRPRERIFADSPLPPPQFADGEEKKENLAAILIATGNNYLNVHSGKEKRVT